jgi:hypothetical protein
LRSKAPQKYDYMFETTIHWRKITLYKAKGVKAPLNGQKLV